MRILIYNWRDWAHARRGGAEFYVHQIAENWVAQGHEVTLFCAAVSGAPASEIIDGVQIVRRGSRFGVYREARKFYKQNRSQTFDLVIEVVNTRPFMCPRFVDNTPVAALIFQVAREVWAHEMSIPTAAIGRYILEPLWLHRYRTARVLTISRSSKDSLEEYGLSDVHVVPVGFSSPTHQSTEVKKESSPTIVFCGRLASNKRPSDAIEAFRIVKSELPDAQLWIVGTGPQEAELKKQAPEGVSFFGHVSHAEKYEIMSKAHVLVATSVREGWGLVVTEAAASGTRTIAYDVAGLRDSVAAAGGTLVSPDPTSLASALIDRLPDWCDNGYDVPPSTSGVVEWDDVAAEVLDAALTTEPEVIDVRTSTNVVNVREPMKAAPFE